MMLDQAINYLIKELKEREANLLESLGGGAAQDYAAYREMCGNIRGLVFAQSLISDLAKKMENFDDE
jgi:hypothetical protein|tara:strand:- start:20 stop:220 length:201 start_codon:yes stop_codon:yes gene_type:complete